MDQTIHFGIDARALAGQRAGKGRYVLGLLEGWSKDASTEPVTVYTNGDLPFTPPKAWQVIAAPPGVKGAYWLTRDARRRRVSLFLSPTSYSVASLAVVPTISVVHDLAVFRCPEARPHWTTWLPERLFLRTALKRSAHILADSDFTKKELTQHFQLSEERVTTVRCGVDEQFRPLSATEIKEIRPTLQKKYALPDTFLLFVGTIEPRKNILRLFEALEHLPRKVARTYPLVMVGKMGWHTTEIARRLHKLTLKGFVVYLDYVEDTDLPLLYNLATAVVYPSIYEGFGLPVLEAMACGVPVVTSATTAIPEVAGDAALLIEPTNVGAIAAGIHRLIIDTGLRRRLIAAGPKRAALFTWNKTAQAARLVMERISKELSADRS